MDEVNRRRRELQERRNAVEKRQAKLYHEHVKKKLGKSILRERRKKAWKNIASQGKYIGKSLKKDYKATQRKRFSKENMARRAVKSRGWKAKRKKRRVGNELDRITHDVLHGFKMP